MHEYEFDKIEDDDNLGGNTKQIKAQDPAAKLTAMVYIPTQRVIVNPKVEVIRNTSETQKVMKLLNGKLLYELPNKIVRGDNTARRIHTRGLNHIQDEG